MDHSRMCVPIQNKSTEDSTDPNYTRDPQKNREEKTNYHWKFVDHELKSLRSTWNITGSGVRALLAVAAGWLHFLYICSSHLECSDDFPDDLHFNVLTLHMHIYIRHHTALFLTLSAAKSQNLKHYSDDLMQPFATNLPFVLKACCKLLYVHKPPPRSASPRSDLLRTSI